MEMGLLEIILINSLLIIRVAPLISSYHGIIGEQCFRTWGGLESHWFAAASLYSLYLRYLEWAGEQENEPAIALQGVMQWASPLLLSWIRTLVRPNPPPLLLPSWTSTSVRPNPSSLLLLSWNSAPAPLMALWSQLPTTSRLGELDIWMRWACDQSGKIACRWRPTKGITQADQLSWGVDRVAWFHQDASFVAVSFVSWGSALIGSSAPGSWTFLERLHAFSLFWLGSGARPSIAQTYYYPFFQSLDRFPPSAPSLSLESFVAGLTTTSGVSWLDESMIGRRDRNIRVKGSTSRPSQWSMRQELIMMDSLGYVWENNIILPSRKKGPQTSPFSTSIPQIPCFAHLTFREAEPRWLILKLVASRNNFHPEGSQ